MKRLVAIAIALLTTAAAAQDHALVVRLSAFSPGDSATESTFDVDSGPIPHAGYRFQHGKHGAIVTVGYQSWDRTDGGTRAELEYLPVSAGYRFVLLPDSPVTPYFGGGVSLFVYDALFEDAGGPVIFASETGAVTALEPIVGVEFLSNRKVRLELEAKYAWQIYSADDLDLGVQTLDVDLSGLFATFGVTFVLN